MVIRPPRVPAGDEVGDHYDELDPFYRELWGEHLHHGLWTEPEDDVPAAVRRLVDRAADRAGVREGTRVCDVGCGYGATARMLARERGARVTGYTLSEAQHRVAVRHVGGGAGTLRFVLGDWLEAAPSPSSFDAVLALESTAHMERKDRFYRTAFRALRPGGRLVVCAWAAQGALPRWQIRHLLVPICVEGRLASLATAREHLTWCREAGFAPPRTEDLSQQVRPTWNVVLRRVLSSLSSRSSRAYLLDPASRHRRFGLAVGRIWVAFRLGALRYLLLAARKPGMGGAARRGGRRPAGAVPAGTVRTSTGRRATMRRDARMRGRTADVLCPPPPHASGARSGRAFRRESRTTVSSGG